MTDLEDGFYWVRTGSYWEIAEHDAEGFWEVTGRSSLRSDTDFDEIDPRRIEREPHVYEAAEKLLQSISDMDPNQEHCSTVAFSELQSALHFCSSKLMKKSSLTNLN